MQSLWSPQATGDRSGWKCHVIPHLMLCQNHLWAPLGAGGEESTYCLLTGCKSLLLGSKTSGRCLRNPLGRGWRQTVPSPSCKANTRCPPELGLHPCSQGLRENFRLSETERLTEEQTSSRSSRCLGKLRKPRRCQAVGRDSSFGCCGTARRKPHCNYRQTLHNHQEHLELGR